MTADSRGGDAVPMLLDYLYWARDRVLAVAAALPPTALLQTPSVHGRDLRATLAHELDVEMSWRGRLRGEPKSAWRPEAEVRPEHFPTLAALGDRWRRDEAAMRAWIAGLSPADLAAPVRVNGLEGHPMAVYLLHVLAHGITELNAASAILHELGRDVGDMGLLNALDEA